MAKPKSSQPQPDAPVPVLGDVVALVNFTMDKPVDDCLAGCQLRVEPASHVMVSDAVAEPFRRRFWRFVTIAPPEADAALVKARGDQSGIHAVLAGYGWTDPSGDGNDLIPRRLIG